MDEIKTPVIDEEKLKKMVAAAKLAEEMVKTAKTPEERVELMLKAARARKEIAKFIIAAYGL